MNPDSHTEGEAHHLQERDFGALARTAASATRFFWDGESATFHRHTQDDETKGAKHVLRPTVTCRCTEELLDAVVAGVDGVPLEGLPLGDMAAAIVDVDPEEFLGASELDYRPFTTALSLATTAKIASASTEVATLESMAEKAKGRCGELVELLLSFSDEDHPFVLFHFIRALRAASAQVEDPRIQEKIDDCFHRVQEETLALLAKRHLDTISPGESVVLAFCAATLAESSQPEYQKAALAALKATVAAQDGAGSWPLGRVVKTDPSRLEIATYEVAWAVARTFKLLLERGRVDLDGAAGESVISAIARAGSFAARSLVELPQVSGWASDHPYQEQRVESWTSAIVLQFAIAAADLGEEVRNRATLATFNVSRPSEALWPPWLTWEKVSGVEPDSEYPIFDYLQRQVIDVIRANPRDLPSGGEESASVLLFGPPGTSKTTIVKAVAQALGWPVVFLNPGVFIARGLEAIEAESQSVFERLHALRRAVVIFDECDELFRDRTPEDGTEQVRNISAFVTASMLPKLQELHDNGRILFFVCTNHVETMDAAVLRGGRIDHRIGVGPYDAAARKKILLDQAPSAPGSALEEEALKALAEDAERFSRNELSRAARILKDRAKAESWADADQARKAAKEVVRKTSDSLTIGTTTYDEFMEHRQTFSDPYVEKKAMK